MANSFKKMIKEKIISRSDSGMFISLDDIHVQPGFNKRKDNERNRLADEETFNYIMSGGVVPPLEVYARDDGGVWIVEGHRRHKGYLRAREAGKPVNRIAIIPFVGDDIQRRARIMTSNNQLKLDVDEQADLIKDLAAFNLKPAEIAKYVNKSIPTIEKLLALSVANHDVQLLVSSGEVSMDVALDRVKEHGEKAGVILEEDKKKAIAAGKKKVTRSVIAPELNAKKARRAVAILAGALTDDDEWEFTPDTWSELTAIINEHKKIKSQAPDVNGGAS
ncbi:chromosome partitioning protein ParB [Pantoea agglomerans]|uniref:ParB/RepB/Spo0J family partition protein n=1 Tax=Enterobacter agglomerans TaxID=549 RepID=UPI003C7BF942